jgi:hyperosmotically inducible protein
MVSTLGRWKRLAVGMALAGALALLPCMSGAEAAGAATDTDTQKITQDVQSRLDKKQFKNVKADVDGNGIATLTGSVDVYEYKLDAEKRTQKAKGVKGVRNQIEVGGPTVPDQELQQKLGEKLAYDRVGYGTTTFNAIGLKVQNGVVTLGGHAYSDVDKDSALAVVSTTPGVKDVIDEIEVDPVSIMDDQIRLAVARAVYRDPQLSKYAIDPAKPIRIQVKGGNVALYGAVNSEADKNLAFIRANAVPNVFSVKNYLQVTGQPAAKEKSEK